jgi:hypothetical protein
VVDGGSALIGLAHHLLVCLHVAMVDELRLTHSVSKRMIRENTPSQTYTLIPPSQIFTPTARSLPGVEEVGVDGSTVVGAVAASGDETRVALERLEDHVTAHTSKQ